MDGVVGIIVLILIVLYAVHRAKTKDERNAKKMQKQEAKDNALSNKMLKKTPAITGKHVTGLPIAEGLQCTLEYINDFIEIKQGNNTFNLETTKVTDITETTDTEIQKQYVSSVGGAVGGAVLFGPLGAIVGGRAKQKKSKTVTHYFVITYRSDEEIKYISFEYTPSKDATDFVAKYNALKPSNTIVNL